METRPLSVPFSDVAVRYDLVVVDTCALNAPLNSVERKDGTLEDKIDFRRMEKFSAEYFLSVAKNHPNFYVTSQVLKEYYAAPTGDFMRKERGTSSYLARLRTSSQVLNEKQLEARKVLNLRRMMDSSKKSIKRLSNMLVENGRVIRLNEDDDEWGRDVFGAFFDMLPILDDGERFSYREFQKAFSPQNRDIGLSSTDLSLVAFALAKYRSGKSIAIVSNDFSIMAAWKHALRINGLYSDQVGFFLRKEPEFFETPYSNR